MSEAIIVELIMFLAIGTGVGVLAAMFGFGGGIIVVPALFLCLGSYQHMPANIVMHLTVGSSLAIMIITAFNSASAHYRHGDMIMSSIKALALPIAIGAVVGAVVSKFLHGDVLRYLFIAFLIYTIAKALLKKGFTAEYKIEDFKLPSVKKTSAVGFFTGLISVLIGIGGSVVTLPFLRKAKMPMVNASSAASALTLSVAVVGAISYIVVGMHSGLVLPKYSLGFIYIPAFIGISLGTFIGVPIGLRLSHFVPDSISAKIYIALLIAVLIVMVI